MQAQVSSDNQGSKEHSRWEITSTTQQRAQSQHSEEDAEKVNTQGDFQSNCASLPNKVSALLL